MLTRSVRDSAIMLDATHGPDVGAPYEIAPPARSFADEVGCDPGRLRIAWTTEPVVSADVHSACIEAVADVVGLLEEMGHELVEAGPAIDGEAFARSFLTIISGELSADLADVERLLGRAARRADLEPTTWALGLLGRALSAEEFSRALRQLEIMGRDVGAFFTKYDVLLTPTLAQPPVQIGSIGTTDGENRLLRFLGMFGSGRLVKAVGLLDEAAKSALDFTPWTAIYNATGQPAMSVPLHWSTDELPIGVHFVGRFGHEATLFRLASQLEQARPWFDRLRPIARSLS